MKKGHGVMVIGGIAALVFMAAFLRSAPEIKRQERSYNEPQESKRPSAVIRSDAGVPGARSVAPPSRAYEKVEVARAMDASNIRQMVRNLMEAAATGNQSLRRSMLRALRRYGRQARDVIGDEIAIAMNPVVRDALEEAMKQAR